MDEFDRRASTHRANKRMEKRPNKFSSVTNNITHPGMILRIKIKEGEQIYGGKLHVTAQNHRA